MEVRLRDESGGSSRAFALSTQHRAGKLGVLLQAADGGARFMLSDAVSGVDLAPDEFIGRVRVRAQQTQRMTQLLPPPCRLSSTCPVLTWRGLTQTQTYDDQVGSFLAQLADAGAVQVRGG